MSLLLLFGGSAGPSNTAALIDFGTPAHTLTTGTDQQRFRVLVRATGPTPPLVTLELYEAGELVTPLVISQAVASETGQIIVAYWDAADLADTSGADVQLRISGSASPDAAVEIGAVVWESRQEDTSTWTGTGAATLPLLTASGVGTKARKGSGTPSLPLLTASGAGTKARTGTGAATLPLVTAAGTGTKARKGSGSPSLPLLTASGTGTKTRSGTGAPTLPLLTASGTAKKTRSGSGTPSLPLITAAGSGTFTEAGTWPGSGAATLPVLEAAGSGTVTRIFEGSGAVTLPILTASGRGFGPYGAGGGRRQWRGFLESTFR